MEKQEVVLRQTMYFWIAVAAPRNNPLAFLRRILIGQPQT